MDGVDVMTDIYGLVRPYRGTLVTDSERGRQMFSH